MEFAVAESKTIFHHCCEDRGISASLDWNEIEPLHSLGELHALASSVNEGSDSQIATNLRLEVVDEKMWHIFSSLLLTPETDNLTSTTMLARLLLTWRLCANAMLKVVTLGQEGEGLQAALSESMIQQQIVSEATIPRTAASWIVETLTSIPSAPLSRFQVMSVMRLHISDVFIHYWEFCNAGGTVTEPRIGQGPADACEYRGSGAQSSLRRVTQLVGRAFNGGPWSDPRSPYRLVGRVRPLTTMPRQYFCDGGTSELCFDCVIKLPQ